MRPWAQREDTSEAVQVRWAALAPTRLAALDQDFASRIRAWPELAAGLLERAARRSDAQVLQAALHKAKHVEDRVLLALWHFAGRRGQIGAEPPQLSDAAPQHRASDREPGPLDGAS